MSYSRKLIDLRNKRFGKLLVLEQVKNPKDTSAYWKCLCDCGTEKIIHGKSLRKGITISCGCHMRTTAKTHGLSDSKSYAVWEGMKARCMNPHRKEYKNYGGRGISVCESWLKFENFYKDMGDPPENHVIDRIDNDGDYSPENCKWSTRTENNNNTRANVPLEIDGVIKNITQWCRFYGVNKNTAFVRIWRGWDPKLAVSKKP